MIVMMTAITPSLKASRRLLFMGAKTHERLGVPDAFDRRGRTGVGRTGHLEHRLDGVQNGIVVDALTVRAGGDGGADQKGGDLVAAVIVRVGFVPRQH